MRVRTSFRTAVVRENAKKHRSGALGNKVLQLALVSFLRAGDSLKLRHYSYRKSEAFSGASHGSLRVSLNHGKAVDEQIRELGSLIGSFVITVHNFGYDRSLQNNVEKRRELFRVLKATT